MHLTFDLGISRVLLILKISIYKSFIFERVVATRKLIVMNTEVIFNNGDEFFNQLKKSISEAKQFIHLETYIFDQDPSGHEILSLLAAAAERGARVQLLLDGVGSASWTFADAQSWRERGIELKFFHALPWQRHPSVIWKLLTIKKLLIGCFKLNRRNHRKICLVDDDTVLISSMNISDRHLPSRVGSQAWRDISVFIQGLDTEHYRLAARDAWNFSQHHHGKRWQKMSQQKKIEYDNLLTQIKSAKEKIWITNPYFVPDFRLTQSLCSAARAGIDVKILLPSQSDIFGLKFAMESYYNSLLTFGVKIFEYEATTLHAKILIIDKWVSIGSFNLDYRSIFYNLETSAILKFEANIEAMQSQFVTDIKTSKKIKINFWKSRSWIHRQLEDFFLLFRGWL